MYHIISTMTRLMAPLLSFTAEEIWQAMPHAEGDVKESVFLNDMPAYDEALAFGDVREKWDRLFLLREPVMKALELARADKVIGKSLDASVAVYAPDETDFALLDAFRAELPTVFIVSQVALYRAAAPEGTLIDEGATIGVVVTAAEGEKCDRCWNYTTSGTKTEDGGCLCPRCLSVLSAN
jgi:isoleucyl-tRNA synthetase